jgi:hypothetical protein
MSLVCENVFIYNYSVASGMRLKIKFNYEAYIRDNERIHHRIGNEVREKFGHIEPISLLEKLTNHYDSIAHAPEVGQDLVAICKQFLVYSFINLIKMNSIWDTPVEKFNSQGLHIIIADWQDKHLGYCAKALIVERQGKLSDIAVRECILAHLKEISPHELLKSYTSASQVFAAPAGIN